MLWGLIVIYPFFQFIYWFHGLKLWSPFQFCWQSLMLCEIVKKMWRTGPHFSCNVVTRTLEPWRLWLWSRLQKLLLNPRSIFYPLWAVTLVQFVFLCSLALFLCEVDFFVASISSLDIASNFITHKMLSSCSIVHINVIRFLSDAFWSELIYTFIHLWLQSGLHG